MLPRPGPPRITLTSTAGTSVPAMYENPSIIKLTPGLEEVDIDAHACTRRAIDHVDRAEFTFGLHEGAPEFGHAPG